MKYSVKYTFSFCATYTYIANYVVYVMFGIIVENFDSRCYSEDILQANIHYAIDKDIF